MWPSTPASTHTHALSYLLLHFVVVGQKGRQKAALVVEGRTALLLFLLLLLLLQAMPGKCCIKCRSSGI